jgi:D-alanine-D-alanine ligase
MKKAALLYNQSKIPDRLDEQDTVEQAHFVAEHLKTLGFKTEIIGCDANLAKLEDQLLVLKPDVVFNGVEAYQDCAKLIHIVPAMIEAWGYRMTGAPSQAIYLTSDKILTKKLLRSHHLPTADWVTKDSINMDSKNKPAAWIVKSIWEDASFGIEDDSVIQTQLPEEVRNKIASKQEKFGGDFFAEAYIDGREFNVGVLEINGEPRVLPIAEMTYHNFEDRPKILTYNAKWKDETYEYEHSSRSFDLSLEDQPLLKSLEKIALDCWHLFCLRGYARVDFRVDHHLNPYILELNSNPSLSSHAGFMVAADKIGLSNRQVIQAIVDAACKAAEQC